jgi:hypothetical protein
MVRPLFSEQVYSVVLITTLNVIIFIGHALVQTLKDNNKQSHQNAQMTDATLSDKKVSFWASNFMTR